MPEIVVEGRYEPQTQERLVEEPPRFEISTATSVIDVETTVRELGEIALSPVVPLPADADFELHLVELGALDGAYIDDLFPARYSTRDHAHIRGRNAVGGRVFVSFTQALDSASVKGATSVIRGGAPVGVNPEYIAAGPGHEVYFDLPGGGSDPIDVVFSTALRTEAGAQVFAVAETVRIADPEYTLPDDNGCERY